MDFGLPEPELEARIRELMNDSLCVHEEEVAAACLFQLSLIAAGGGRNRERLRLCLRLARLRQDAASFAYVGFALEACGRFRCASDFLTRALRLADVPGSKGMTQLLRLAIEMSRHRVGGLKRS